MSELINRIHAYQRTKYDQHHVVIVPPFTMLFHKTDDSPEASCAIPNESLRGDLTESLSMLQAAFAQRGRTPRIQYLDVLNPTLTPILNANGFELQQQLTVLACTPNIFRPVLAMPGLTTVILSQNSSIEDIQEELETRELGFDPQAVQLSDTNAEIFRRSLITGRAFILRLHRKPVTTGRFIEIHDRVAEIVAVATLPAFRRRGFAAYLIGYMTQVAFARQVDLVFLAAPDDGIANVYKRVGYKSVATLLTYHHE